MHLKIIFLLLFMVGYVNMSNSGGLCYILVLAVCVGLVIFGFVQLLQKEKPSENDVQVVQRQLRGFAYLLLAQIILVLGIALCLGLNKETIKGSLYDAIARMRT